MISRRGLGYGILGTLLVLWVASLLIFMVLRYSPNLFQVQMGFLALAYGLSIVVFRKEAADLASRFSTNRLMFTSTPRYRPGYIAFTGAGFAVIGGLMLLTGLAHLR